MKKIIYVAFIFLLGINIASAKPITPATAKTIAENFYKQNSSVAITSITLVHTELSYTGVPLYYTFDINTNDGFVIVSAEDAIRPIVGYSTKNHSTQVEKGSNIGYWMEKTSAKINAIRKKGYIANESTSAEWTGYINNLPVKSTNATERQVGGASSGVLGTPAMTPLMLSTWNQSPYYNAYCPGSTGLGTNAAASVTGCVATTIAQIMRYWSYPAHGTGSHSYTQNPNTYGYPAQSADFGTTTYDWANMPYANSAVTATTYSPIAQLMYQCGVSVNMHYDPTGSGAQVLGSGGPSAQYSYINYFSYDANQIRGLQRSYGTNYSSATYYYSDAAWIDSVASDLNIGRPVQYVGDDSIGAGHTWVCDGYDSNGNLHMNWGWGGAYDGYFAVSDLTTAGGTADVFDPRYNDQMLKGIVPPTTNAYDAGVPAITSPVGYYCSAGTNTLNVSINLENFGSTALTSCTINYSIDGGAVQTQNWTGSLVSYQKTIVNLPVITGTMGSHTLVCYSSNPDGATDGSPLNDTSTVTFNITGGGVLPIVEGFESASTLPNANWNISHSAASGLDFAISSAAAASGSQSCMLNNLSNVGGDTTILETASTFNMTTITSPVLTFAAAYEKQSTAANADKLQILTSTDCGNSWVSRKTITSTTLASLAGGTGTSPYTPAPTQFTTYTVIINAVASSPNVMFRWSFIADPTAPGNNLYIDNINLASATTGIENIETSVGLNLYPNPSTGKVNIDFNLSEQHTVSVVVTDMLGRTVETIPSTSYQSGETTLAVGANSAYQAGVYLVNISIDGQHIAKKVIIQ